MSPTPPFPDPLLLERFLVGRATDEEQAHLERILSAPGGPVLSEPPICDPLMDTLRGVADVTPLPDTAAVEDRLCRLVQRADTLAVLGAPEAAGEVGRLGGYRVLRSLGSGGMGHVFLAEDAGLRRRVALKVLRPHAAVLPQARERFLREARAAAALDHENVVPVFHVGEERGVAFVAMPALEGETLDDRLRRDGPLPVPELLRLGREAAAGLAAAHAAGLIHRDVKPANLWLQPLPEGGFRARLLDFGLALAADGDERLTQTGLVVGSPGYMAPEQIDGGPLDVRCDLFALGCVLYYAATGTPPFPGKSVSAVMRAAADADPEPPHCIRPELPRSLSNLILSLLQKDPARRPMSASAVAAAFRTLEAGDRPLIRRRLRRLGVLVGVAVLLGAVALLPCMGRLTSPGSAGPYVGGVDVVVWSKDGERVRRRLADEGALPLRSGDKVRLVASALPAAYLYLFWIDAEGRVDPVYPWEPGRWGSRPAPERPVASLGLPEQVTLGYTVRGEEGGMETFLLLARDAPWELSDEGVRGLLQGLPAQRPLQDPRSAVWFENGHVVEKAGPRQRSHFEVGVIDDPVLRIQELLRDRLAPHARFTAAVSFARLGPGEGDR